MNRKLIFFFLGLFFFSFQITKTQFGRNRPGKVKLYNMHWQDYYILTGKLMTVLHSPNNRSSRPHNFEMEDSGNYLRIKREL